MTTARNTRLTDGDFAALQRDSWIDATTAERFGLYRVDSVEGATLVGRQDGENYTGVAFPVYWPGQAPPREYILRRDRPTLEQRADGSYKEAQKYLWPPGRGNLLLFGPEESPDAISDITVPILLVEGIKKLCAGWRFSRHDRELPLFLTCAISGVWNWRGTIGRTTGPDGGRVTIKGPIPDLSRVEWKDRLVYLVFDNDAATNEKVAQALDAFAAELRGRQAHVVVMNLPAFDGKEKTGFDDLLAQWGPERVYEWLADTDKQLAAGPVRLNAGDGDLSRLSRLTWAALEAQNDPPFLFRYGGVVSRIEQDDEDQVILREITVDRLRYELAHRMRWWRRRSSDNAIRAAHPPLPLCRNMLARPDPPLPRLTRIVEAPTFTSDGTLAATPGYHAAACLWYSPAPGFTVPPIPSCPTQDDIGRARTLLLNEWLWDFPFTGPPERAAALALCLLPFVRELVDGPTPLHLIEKPIAGTGATLLISVLTFLFTGHVLAVMTEGRDEDEWRKRITAKLSCGPSIVLIDNLRHPLDSAALSSAITASSWEDRRLGHTEIIRMPVRCTWVATGNNPAVSAEISRRIVRVRLDAQMDRPWLRRTFRHPDLMGWTVAHRAELVAAILTLVRAWLAAGRPLGPRTLGMFESWSQVLGGMLSLAGVPGLLENVHEFYDRSDAEGAACRTFLEAWWSQYEDKPVGVSELYAVFMAEDESLDLGLGDGSTKSQKIRLGKRLAEMRDRQFGRWRIIRDGTKRRASQWRLVESAEPPASPDMEEVDLAD